MLTKSLSCLISLSNRTLCSFSLYAHSVATLDNCRTEEAGYKSGKSQRTHVINVTNQVLCIAWLIVIRYNSIMLIMFLTVNLLCTRYA